MRVLAIDPGTEKSAWVWWDGERILSMGLDANDDVLRMLNEMSTHDTDLCIEWIESYGMAVGKEVFLTCRWAGRFHQVWEGWGGEVSYMARKNVKLHLCNSLRAKDANIRQALLDRLGPQGTKKNPGVTYGVRKDIWAALGVAVTWMDSQQSEQVEASK